MPIVDEEDAAGGDLPDLNGFVYARGGDAGAIGGPGDGKDFVGMSSEGEEGIFGTDLPDLNGVVVAGGGDAFAIG